MTAERHKSKKPLPQNHVARTNEVLRCCRRRFRLLLLTWLRIRAATNAGVTFLSPYVLSIFWLLVMATDVCRVCGGAARSLPAPCGREACDA